MEAPAAAASAAVNVIMDSLIALQNLEGDPGEVIKFWVPDFFLRSNGHTYDRLSFAEMWKERQAKLNRPQARFVDIFERHGWVASWRHAAISTKHGTQAPAVVIIDIWHVEGGQVVSCDQCWQVLHAPSDELAATPQEGRNAEVVRGALECLADLRHAQDTLSRYWCPAFVGCMDGVRMDMAALRQHWAALQGSFATMRVEVKEVVAHGGAVGVVYHNLAEKRGGGTAETRVVAVMDMTDGKISGCKAVSRLIHGGPEDDNLLTRMP